MGIKTVISLVPGTCSFEAIKQYKHQLEGKGSGVIEVKHVDSFYEGRAVLEQMQDARVVMLIPHVHELCAHLTIHTNFELLVEEVFHKPNPPLYLASGKKKENPATEKRCACVTALKPLIPDQKNDLFQFYPVHNTQEAAESVKIGECGYCVTNEYGLKKYELREVERLKQMTVLWFPFRWQVTK